jgi:precorrin-6B methylase 2
VCQKLELSPGDHLLEIGTGWGALALHAAGRFEARVTTTTLSQQQRLLALERVRAAGLGRQVEVLERDYRDLNGSFDKLVSVEMIEAVGAEYYDTYFRKCGELLKPGGLMALQSITIADHLYERHRREVDFIKRHIFPGSNIPSVAALTASVARSSELCPARPRGLRCPLRAHAGRLARPARAPRGLGGRALRPALLSLLDVLPRVLRSWILRGLHQRGANAVSATALEVVMRLVKRMLLCVLVWASHAGAQGSSVERYSGVARSPSGEFLYREQHEVIERDGRPLRALTSYYDRAGKKLAELDSDFAASSFAPDYRFLDLRSGKRESAKVTRLALFLSYAGQRKQLDLPEGETLVVGQGMHHFARLNLERLAREPASVRFAIPSRLDTYAFRIRPLEGGRSAGTFACASMWTIGCSASFAGGPAPKHRVSSYDVRRTRPPARNITEARCFQPWRQPDGADAQ